MNVKKLFLLMAAVSGALALCQCSSEAPPPPGTVRMVDQQAIALMQDARAKEAKNDLSGAIKTPPFQGSSPGPVQNGGTL